MHTHIFVRGRPLGSVLEACLLTLRVEEGWRIKIDIDILEIRCHQWNILPDGYVVVAILKGIDSRCSRKADQDCLSQHCQQQKLDTLTKKLVDEGNTCFYNLQGPKEVAHYVRLYFLLPCSNSPQNRKIVRHQRTSIDLSMKSGESTGNRRLGTEEISLIGKLARLELGIVGSCSINLVDFERG